MYLPIDLAFFLCYGVHMSKKVIIFDFQQESNKRYRNKTISLTKASVFSFNSGFYSDSEIYNFTHVIPGYNKADKAIGFKFVKVKIGEKKPEGALTISIDPKGNYGKAAALAFISKNHIDVNSYSGKYPPHVQNDPKQGKTFYILLDEKVK